MELALPSDPVNPATDPPEIDTRYSASLGGDGPEIQFARLEAAVSNMAEGISMFDGESRLVISNKLYAEIYELPAELTRAGTLHRDIVAYRLNHGMEPFSGGDFMKRHQELLSETKASVETVKLRNGRIVMIRHQTLAIGGWVATHLDITEQEMRKKELHEQNVRFDLAINNMQQGLCMYDADRRLIVSNRRYAEMYRIPADKIVPGMLLEEVLALRLSYGNRPAEGGAAYLANGKELLDNAGVEADIVEFDDGRVISILHRPIPDGGKVSTHQDITEQRRNEARIRHLARHDALTDLLNRSAFQDHLNTIPPRIKRGGQAALLVVDLDRFKEINDTLGHDAGDTVLKLTAARLIACCREGDVVARLGGDELAILQTQINSPDDAATLARRVVERLCEPFEIGGNRVMIGASVGIAVASASDASAETLMKAADLALYRAKNEGRGGFRFYEAGMDAEQRRRRIVEHDLEVALQKGEFSLVFQPLLNMVDSRIHAVEALLRWTNAEGVLVRPGEFLSIAEESGLIVPMGAWVLREACRVASEWPSDVRVTVNISPVQLKTDRLVDDVKKALAAARLEPERLELEIPEQALLGEDVLPHRTLRELHRIGVSISIDDFGSGGSLLGKLKSFPFDKMKIDGAFIRGSSVDPASRDLVRIVIALGKSLGMKTVAEGIETESQLDLVRENGCSEVQGYLLSPPLPARAISEMIMGGRGDAKGRQAAP